MHIYITKFSFGRRYMMKDYIEKRSVLLAEYIISHKATVRAAAKKFGISKSTVHKDISESENKRERHLRGGLATKRKYMEKEKGLSK